MLTRAAAASPSRRTVLGPAQPAATGPDGFADLGHGARRPFVLPPLPYGDHELAPVISPRTVHFHHHRHHAGYITTLNRLLANHPLAGESLVTIIRESVGNPTRTGLFNNAAQVWNHGFYWRCLTPGGGGRPTGSIAAAIEREFGGYAAFRERMIDAAVGQFGSGWAWLCAEDDRLTLRRTSNADTPVQQAGITPLLTIDVWEHAYYLDYQNRRAEHVTQVVDRLFNWSFASRNLDAHRQLRAAPADRDEVAAPVPAPVPPPAAAPARLVARPAESRAASLSRLARTR